MKPYIYLYAAFVTVGLMSCKAHKEAMVTETSETANRTDTTKITFGMLKHRQQTAATDSTAASSERAGAVEFVDGGGKLTVDTAGNIILEGVKQVRVVDKTNISQATSSSESTEQAYGHREQANGITETHDTNTKQTQTKLPAQKWYNTLFARIGQGVCIAVLLWILFIYLRRKK